MSTRQKVVNVFCCSVIIVIMWALISDVNALDNGLAKTPPMGWNSWNIFHENINEDQIKEIADAMVNSGMKDAGYVYLNLDDNWMADSRDQDGNLRADPERFPSGMKALGDYIHSKGLKFGIYGDRGLRTCHHYHSDINSGSGSYGKEQRDAETFASWGVDYLKYDNCDPAPGSDMQEDYENMRDALANCGRDIVYSICAWGYQGWMPETGNLWRTTGDISDTWDAGDDWFRGIINIIDENAEYASSASPGAWNDPDMLQIGNGGCTEDEYRTHMSMWCMMAAPLIAGHDVRNMSQTTKDILLNEEIIAVNQDSAGIQGTRVSTNNGLEVWSKPLGSAEGPEKAVALLNRNSSQEDITVEFSDIGVSEGDSVLIRDLWAKEDKGLFTESYTASVVSHGTAMLKIRKTAGKRSAFAVIEAESYYSNSGVQIETCSEGGEDIGYIENGDYTVYKSIDFDSGASEFEIRAASGGEGGNIEIRLDSINGDLAGSCEITGTGDWQTWSTFTGSVGSIQGEHDLYLRFTGGDGYLFNLNWFQFISESVATGKQVVKNFPVTGYSINTVNSSIVVSSKSSYSKFSISVYMPNGRKVFQNITSTDGVIKVPVKSSGIYIINIKSNGHAGKKRIYVF